MKAATRVFPLVSAMLLMSYLAVSALARPATNARWAMTGKDARHTGRQVFTPPRRRRGRYSPLGLRHRRLHPQASGVARD